MPRDDHWVPILIMPDDPLYVLDLMIQCISLSFSPPSDTHTNYKFPIFSLFINSSEHSTNMILFYLLSQYENFFCNMIFRGNELYKS